METDGDRAREKERERERFLKREAILDERERTRETEGEIKRATESKRTAQIERERGQ